MIGKLLETIGQAEDIGSINSKGKHNGGNGFAKVLKSFSNNQNINFANGLDPKIEELGIRQFEKHRGIISAPGSSVSGGVKKQPTQPQGQPAPQKAGTLSTVLGMLGGGNSFGSLIPQNSNMLPNGAGGGLSNFGSTSMPIQGLAGLGALNAGTGMTGLSNVASQSFSFPQGGAGGILPIVLTPVIGLFTFLKSIFTGKKKMEITSSLNPVDTSGIKTSYEQSEDYFGSLESHEGSFNEPQPLETHGFGETNLDSNNLSYF